MDRGRFETYNPVLVHKKADAGTIEAQMKRLGKKTSYIVSVTKHDSIKGELKEVLLRNQNVDTMVTYSNRVVSLKRILK